MATAAVSNNSLEQVVEALEQQRRTDLRQLGSALEHGDLSGAQSAYNAIQTLAQSSSSGARAFHLSRRQAEFEAIGRYLQSGNLAGAQRAFAELRNNRASNPENAGGSQQLPPAVVIEISGQATATANSTASDAASTSAASVGAGAATNASPAPDVASSNAPPAIGATEVPPPAEPLVTLTLQGGNSGGIEIDLGLANPATPARATTATTPSAASSASTPTGADTSVGSSTVASPVENPAPEIVVNLNPGALGAGSEIDITLGKSSNGGELFSLGVGTQANPRQEQININLAQNANEQIVLNLLGSSAANPRLSPSAASGTLLNISI